MTNKDSEYKINEISVFKEKLRLLKERLTSKSLWGSIILALVLWFFASLNDNYNINIEVPIKYTIPTNRAFENELPKTATYQFSGNGWSLFNLKYFNTAKTCNLNLHKYYSQSDEVLITRDILLKSLEYTGNTSALEVYPDNLNIKLGFNAEKYVKVKSKVKIQPNTNFILVGEQKVNPQYITIFGNTKILDTIKSWNTEHVSFNNIKDNFYKTIKLEDKSNNIIKLNRKNVTIKQEVDMLFDYEIEDVPVNIIGSLDKFHSIYPNKVTIVVRGGFNQITNSNLADKIKVNIDSKSIENDTYGYISPKIEIPNEFEIIDIKPRFLKHLVVKRL